jgi:hypothetical protein
MTWLGLAKIHTEFWLHILFLIGVDDIVLDVDDLAFEDFYKLDSFVMTTPKTLIEGIVQIDSCIIL